VEATNQQLRLKDRKDEEQRGELTACMEELAKCNARIDDFEAWDMGDLELLAGGIQP
jgi:hypothetical protein